MASIFSEAVDDYEKKFLLKWKEYRNQSTGTKILAIVEKYGTIFCIILFSIGLLAFSFKFCCLCCDKVPHSQPANSNN